ncbi:hypothetical protein [Pedobacter lusitanus]|nr:hypothetical protein [Pedobacter lusitanus]
MEELIETPRCAKNLQKIKEMLESGKVVTVISIKRTVNTYEGRHYLAILKKTMNIIREWVTSPNGRRYKKYWLSKQPK